ncbi:MAG: PorP/SprF family type IX secretion system membrane protein [Bacteroidales bacterium]|nr:PorP/SprF family type IX secretion system membrane protein [Bacteroidales bacterium]
MFSILVLTTAITTSKAQDPNFSQYFFKEMYYNPAFTGINPGLRGVITTRNLWTSVLGNYSTQSLAFDFFDRKFATGGLGAMVTKNTQGENFLDTWMAQIMYAKRITLTPDFIIQIGAGVSYIHRSINYEELVFSDQLDPRFGNIYETEFVEGIGSKGKFDVNTGLAMRFNLKQSPVKIWATNTIGCAFHHLTQPDFSMLDDGNEARLPIKFNANWYSMIKVNRSSFYNTYFLLAPGVIWESQAEAETWFDGLPTESGSKTLSFGFNAIIPSKLSFISSLYTGVWFRAQYLPYDKLSDYKIEGNSLDAVIFMLGYIKYSRNMKRLYRVSYSYDMTVSSAGLNTGGTHELNISFEIHDLALPGRTGSRSAIPHPADRFFHMGR